MGRIHIDLFTTLDGVAQAPGAPEEDPARGFAFGGWQAPLFDDVVGEQVWAGLEGADALLLGRRTYDIFAGHWPHEEGEIAELFNRIPKYVASRSADLEPGWSGSARLGDDLPAAVREVRERHEAVHVIGSLDLVQTLLAEHLFDRLTLWVHPVLLGPGKRVFEGDAAPAILELCEAAVTTPKGTVRLRYALADGTPGTGDMASGEHRG